MTNDVVMVIITHKSNMQNNMNWKKKNFEYKKEKQFNPKTKHASIMMFDLCR